jgi:hypothetical protein
MYSARFIERKGQGLTVLLIFEPMNPDGFINFNGTEAMK